MPPPTTPTRIPTKPLYPLSALPILHYTLQLLLTTTLFLLISLLIKHMYSGGSAAFFSFLAFLGWAGIISLCVGVVGSFAFCGWCWVKGVRDDFGGPPWGGVVRPGRLSDAAVVDGVRRLSVVQGDESGVVKGMHVRELHVRELATAYLPGRGRRNGIVGPLEAHGGDMV